MIEKSAATYLKIANVYANLESGCRKVAVGSIIVKNDRVIALGANRSIPDLCKSVECLRVQKYGDDAKSHRLPSDCRAVHSEIDAISSCIGDTCGSTIYVTRYPCEACARAISAAGIKKVVYAREQVISEETASIFEYSGIQVTHIKNFGLEDTDR